MQAPVPPLPPMPPSPWHASRWERFSAALVRGFHAYAGWLVGISWKRFALLSLLLAILAAVLEDLPPFTWRLSEHVQEKPRKFVQKPTGAKQAPQVGLEVTIDERGVRIGPRAASAPDAAASSASAPAGRPKEGSVEVRLPSVQISVPRGADHSDVKEVVDEVRAAIAEAVAEVRDGVGADGAARRVVVVRLGDYLMNLVLLWIVASAIIKINYKGRMQAEVKAAQATEAAESESLKRQVVEARMAAMQAQVEPHFLFNTLASIDHLIEVDPPRASVMQKNLIALLRASMPTMREANAQGTGNLARELEVVRPYLEILKLRMEERLQVEVQVPDGLLSAEFPPMMMQSLVENAIKHGLEPKPDGGRLSVRAEIVHGKLVVTVADTGLGFGKAATAGTGVGLANLRERLQLLYGGKAQLSITDNGPSGTIVTVTVPYVATTPEGAKA